MITIEKRGAVLLLARGGQTFALPAAEASSLIGAVLDALGVRGSERQQGYQLGVQDGLIEGYLRRDREYITAAAKAWRAHDQAERLALLAALDGDARTA